MYLSDIMQATLKLKCNLALITGGEPLLQKNSLNLLQALNDIGCKTLVETNGSIDISMLPEKTVAIVDVKCPGSGELGKFCWDNLKYLRPTDEVKFVITTRQDYEWSRTFIGQNLSDFTGQILLSPAFELLDPEEIISWILKDDLHVRFQLQLHKVIWGPMKRGV